MHALVFRIVCFVLTRMDLVNFISWGKKPKKQKNTTSCWNYRFLPSWGKAHPPSFPFMLNVVSISALLLPFPVEGQKPLGALGKVWSICKLGASHVVPPVPPTQPSPKCPASRRCHPSAAITAIAKAAFTGLLKRQISFIVSSLSAFSNHSHGFALFILIVLLMIRVILCLQLSQRSEGLAVSNRRRERVCRLTPRSSTSIDFPSVCEWQRWALFFFFFFNSYLVFALHSSPTSQRKAVCSSPGATRAFTEAHPRRKQGPCRCEALLNKSAHTCFFSYCFRLFSSGPFGVSIS